MHHPVKIDLWWYSSNNILGLEVVPFGVGCAELNSHGHMGDWQFCGQGCEQEKSNISCIFGIAVLMLNLGNCEMSFNEIPGILEIRSPLHGIFPYKVSTCNSLVAFFEYTFRTANSLNLAETSSCSPKMILGNWRPLSPAGKFSCCFPLPFCVRQLMIFVCPVMGKQFPPSHIRTKSDFYFDFWVTFFSLSHVAA